MRLRQDPGPVGLAQPIDAAGIPSRRWCREVLTLRAAAGALLASGAALTDPRVLALSRRMDRLILPAFHPQPATPASPPTGLAGGLAPRASEPAAPGRDHGRSMGRTSSPVPG